jgi:hypothetical protein
MSKLTLLGILTWLVSGVLLGFQAISLAMGKEETWDNISLVDAVGETQFAWVEGITMAFIQKPVEYLVSMPLFLLLFCLGMLFFIINTFVKT